MPIYRLFPIAPDGKIADAPMIIEASHDNAALILGERVLDGRTVEVWEGTKLIGVVLGSPSHDQLAEVREAFGASSFHQR